MSIMKVGAIGALMAMLIAPVPGHADVVDTFHKVGHSVVHGAKQAGHTVKSGTANVGHSIVAGWNSFKHNVTGH